MKSNKIDVCKVSFDSNRFVFYPGEKINGKLKLEMNRSMDMECIQVICKGKEEAEWKEIYYDENQEKQERKYESKKKIFELKKNVSGDGEKESHPAGEHEYPFSFDLPEKCPSSFEGKHGYIRYFVKVVIKKSWKKDLKLKKMFVVNSAVNVNNGKFNAAPGDEDQKTLGCLCCASGPLELAANLNRSGYCGGENILVTAKVDNNTSRDMDDLEVKLIRKVSYEAKLEGGDYNGHNNEEDVIAELKNGKIEEGKKMKWEQKKMAIPPVVPDINSKFIDVKYYVYVHLDVPMGIDMDFKLPVNIGSVPFQATYEEAAASEQKHKPKTLEKIGNPPMEFLGQGSMKPFQYSVILKDKPKKMNKEEKEFQEDNYQPVYTFAFPAKESSGSRSGTPCEGPKDNLPPIQ